MPCFFTHQWAVSILTTCCIGEDGVIWPLARQAYSWSWLAGPPFPRTEDPRILDCVVYSCLRKTHPLSGFLIYSPVLAPNPPKGKFQ